MLIPNCKRLFFFGGSINSTWMDCGHGPDAWAYIISVAEFDFELLTLILQYVDIFFDGITTMSRSIRVSNARESSMIQRST